MIINKSIINSDLKIEKYLFDNVQKSVAYALKDIKQFDFDYLENADLNQIKTRLGVSVLQLNKATNINGKKLIYTDIRII